MTLQQNNQEIPVYVAKLVNPAQLRTVMAHAKNRGREDVYRVAFLRLCEIEGMNHEDPLHREFYAVLTAYEEMLTEKNGKTTKASRTRQKLARHTVEKCLEDWALSSKPTQGFKTLISGGFPELTAEYLVVKYADRFTYDAVSAAKSRLQAEGFNFEDNRAPNR